MDDDVRGRLSHKVGENTVSENIENALLKGLLKEGEGGLLKPIVQDADKKPDYYIVNTPINRNNCFFLDTFLYEIAYQENCIPFGCQACYKVKVIPRSLRELMAMFDVINTVGCSSKIGVEVDNPTTSSIYAGYFYTLGLEDGKRTFQQVRNAVTNHPKLGMDVPVVLKRGCTHFEMKFGPSNTWTFDPRLQAVESCLEKLFDGETKRLEHVKSKTDKMTFFSRWLGTAFRIGDTTYLEFTGGKPLLSTVTYHKD